MNSGRLLAFQNDVSCILGGLNDCAECKDGFLTGACYPDTVACQKATMPWKIVCPDLYNDAPDKNRVWEVAGQSGCSDCGADRYVEYLQEKCATTCNYCSDISISTTTTTTTTIITTTTTTQNTRKIQFLTIFKIDREYS